MTTYKNALISINNVWNTSLHRHIILNDVAYLSEKKNNTFDKTLKLAIRKTRNKIKNALNAR